MSQFVTANRGESSRGGRGRRNWRGGNRGGFKNWYNKRPPMNQSNGGKRTKFEVTNRLKEVDVGITEFLGEHEHFTGIMKERFNDFQVREINRDGEIAKLTNQDVPPIPEETSQEDPRQVLPPEVLEKIDSILADESTVQCVEIDVTDLDKDKRRMIHALVKKKPSIQSNTYDMKDNKKVMVLCVIDKKQKRFAHRKDARIDWSCCDGHYCRFLLHKVNMDTMDALNQMSHHLRIKPNIFYYAGTKDRRARTTQWISLRKIAPHDIKEAVKRIRGAYVGNFKFVKEPLRLGNLLGNRFTIGLRNVTATDDEMNAAMTSLRDVGFINYYGLQRFGTIANIPTHAIGKALLQGNWEIAVDLVLKPRQGDHQDLAEAREIWAQTKDASEALKKLYRHDKIEAKLLKGIKLTGKSNLQGAFDYIPRNTRLMYVHAYQSLVWNNMVSRRIREYGRKPIVGDLVYVLSDVKEETLDYLAHDDEEEKNKDAKEDKKNGETAAAAMDSTNKTEAKSEDDQRMEADPTEDQKKDSAEAKVATESEEAQENSKDDESIDEKNNHPIPAVKVLTEEDLPNYTIADVVMPLPGWRIIYPSYAKEWYEEFITNDGLSLDLKKKNRKYSLSGTYRKIVGVPDNLTWKIMHYKDIKDELISNDIEEMKGNPGPKDDPEGKYKALILEMSLKSSTYATMALREVLKHDTSADTQAAQSAAYHAQDEAENKQPDGENSKKDGAEEKDVSRQENEKVEAEQENKMEVETKDVQPMEDESISDSIEGKDAKELPMEQEPIPE